MTKSTENKVLSNSVVEKLTALDFASLASIIEKCLDGHQSVSNGTLTELYTEDKSALEEYVEFLEIKIVHPLKPSVFPSFQEMDRNIALRTRERLRRELEQRLTALNSGGLSRKERVLKEVEIKTFQKIIGEYDTRIEKSRRDSSASKPHNQQLVKYEMQQRKEEAQRTVVAKLKERIHAIPHTVGIELEPVPLNWKLLPKGEIGMNHLRPFLQQASGSFGETTDWEKIENIIALSPDKLFFGVEEFDGYLVFYFERSEQAVLDSPKRGNAIYIFGEDWKTLSNLSKSELLNHHRHEIRRIVHKGDWLERLREIIL